VAYRVRIISQLVEQAQHVRATYPNLRKITANIGWLLTDNMLRLMAALAVNAWVVRYLGPERYGDLSFALAFVTLFAPLATLGLNTIVVRDLVRRPDSEGETLGSAFALVAVGSSVTVMLVVITVLTLRPQDGLMHRLVLVLSISTSFQAFSVIDAWFQSQVVSKYTVYARNVALVLSSFFRVGCILTQAPLTAFAVAYAVESGLYALALVIVYHHRSLGSKAMRVWQVRLSRVKSLLKDSWPLLLEGIAIMIYMRVDQTMLGQMLSGEQGRRELGLYSAAVRLSEIWYFVPTAVISSFFPTIVKSRELGEAEYHRRIQRLLNFLVLLSYGVAVPMTLMSGAIVRLLYGDEYRPAAPMFAILIWAGVWVSLGLVRSAVIQIENRQILSLSASVLGAVSNVGMNLLLIPWLGGIGTAISTVISQCISAYASLFLFVPLRKLAKMQTRALVFPNPFRVVYPK
jgi:O-antigen/teichoic acid export membrane protein